MIFIDDQGVRTWNQMRIDIEPGQFEIAVTGSFLGTEPGFKVAIDDILVEPHECERSGKLSYCFSIDCHIDLGGGGVIRSLFVISLLRQFLILWNYLLGSLNQFHFWRVSRTRWQRSHYSDIIMSAMASKITDVSIVCSVVCWGADQRKHQSSASLAFVRGIHRWTVCIPLTKGQ